MKRLLMLSLIIGACNSSKVRLLTKDSFEFYQKKNAADLADMVKMLEDVYEKQYDLAKHAFDDSINYWQGKYEIAEAGGKNYYIISGFEQKVLMFKKKAADSLFHLASIHAKKEQDKVWQMKDKAQKDSEIYTMQGRFEKGEITETQYNETVKRIHDRPFHSPVTEANALKMSIDYNKRLYEEALNRQQQLLESRVDSLSK